MVQSGSEFVIGWNINQIQAQEIDEYFQSLTMWCYSRGFKQIYIFQSKRIQKLRKQLKYRNRSTLAGNIYTYWYVTSKFDDAIFIIHVTGETNVLHKKVFFDERHGGSQEERHKQVDVDGVARAVELSTTDSMVLLISSFLSDMGTANYYIVVLLGLPLYLEYRIHF